MNEEEKELFKKAKRLYVCIDERGFIWVEKKYAYNGLTEYVKSYVGYYDTDYDVINIFPRNGQDKTLIKL